MSNIIRFLLFIEAIVGFLADIIFDVRWLTPKLETALLALILAELIDIKNNKTVKD